MELVFRTSQLGNNWAKRTIIGQFYLRDMCESVR